MPAFSNFLNVKLTLISVFFVAFLMGTAEAEKSYLQLTWYEHILVLVVGLFVGYLGGYAGIGGAYPRTHLQYPTCINYLKTVRLARHLCLQTAYFSISFRNFITFLL